MTEPDLPWRRSFGRGCRARLEPNAEGAGPHHGRCELRPHPPAIDHALDRGFDTVRFRTAVVRV